MLHRIQAVRQVVFTDVLIIGRLDVDGQSFGPIGVHKIDLPMIGCSLNGTPMVWKACREFRYKINRRTAAIGVILAFTGKKMFYFN
jgi:hypothetical protein